MDHHLTPDLVRAWLAGALDEIEEQALRAHLARGECPTCDQGLAALSDQDEAALRATLGRVESVPMRPPAGLRQAVLQAVAQPPFWRRRLVLGPVLAGVAALGLLLTLWLRPFGPAAGWPTAGPGPDGGLREKGPSASAGAVDLELALALEGPDGRTRVERVPAGASLTPQGRLLFRLRLEGACHLYLLRIDGLGLEVLLPGGGEPPASLGAGWHVPVQGGAPLALPLMELAGPQRFVALCAPGPLDPAELRLAAGPGVDGPAAPEAVGGRSGELRVRVGDP